MNKLILLTGCFLLTGCVYTPIDLITDVVDYLSPEELPVIPETITNPECELFGYGVFINQVLKEGILAEIASKNEYDRYYISNNHVNPIANLLYIPTKTKDMYNGQLLLFDNQCLQTDGIYKYISTTGAQNTIRKVKVIKRNIPNPKHTKTNNNL